MSRTTTSGALGLRILEILAGLGLIVGLYFAFAYAPTESTMGNVQRIFYFHVPAAWAGFLAFLLVFIASIGWLVTRRSGWDRLAVASAEVGVLFATIVLVTGPIWGKYAWGIWWTWDARLTSTLVLWLIYAGYLMLRRYIPEPHKRANLSAVVGILGFLDVPLVFFSIRWWRTQHPSPVIAGGEGSGLDSQMLTALLVCVAVFTALAVWLIFQRVVVERASEEADSLWRQYQETGHGA